MKDEEPRQSNKDASDFKNKVERYLELLDKMYNVKIDYFALATIIQLNEES